MSKNSNSFENISFDDSIIIIKNSTYPTDYPTHWHKCVELMYLPITETVNVCPIVTINQDTYEMHPGDVVITWSGELHKVSNNSERKLIGLQFYPSVFDSAKDFSAYWNIFRSYHHISQGEFPDLAQNMGMYLDHINSLAFSGEPFRDTQMLIALFEMFMYFGIYLRDRLKKDDVSMSPESNRTIQIIVKACAYIQENCEQQMTLQTVSDYVGFSPFYLSRLFKKVTNSSFMEYLTNQRIKRAQTLLVDSDLSVTEISYQSGFTSISTFNRVFKKYRGCSPSSYRKYYDKK